MKVWFHELYKVQMHSFSVTISDCPIVYYADRYFELCYTIDFISMIIALMQGDQQTAANHMYIAALAVAALAIAFAVSITFTDRPPEPKSSQE